MTFWSWFQAFDRRYRRLPRRWPLLRLGELLGKILVPFPRHGGGTLLIRFYGVGDALIFRVGLLAWLRSSDPIVREPILILGSNSWEFAYDAFFDGFPSNVQFLFVNERRLAKSIFYRAKIIALIRRCRFDRAACLMHYRNPLTTDALVANSGALAREVVVGDEPLKWREAFRVHRLTMTRVIKSLDSKPSSQDRDPDGGPVYPHEIDRLMDALQQWRNLNLGPRPALHLERPKLPRCVDGVPAGPYAVIIPGSSNANRSMPPAQAAAIAVALSRSIGHCIVIGGPAELPMLPALKSALETHASAQDAVTISFGAFEFNISMALVGEAEVVVGQDTGPTHAALMMGVPTVALHSDPSKTGAKEWGTFMPYPEKSQKGMSFHLLFPLDKFTASRPDDGMVQAALAAVERLLSCKKNSGTELSGGLSFSWRYFYDENETKR